MFDFAPQAEPEVVTVLRNARALVATPGKWCQGVGETDDDARCMSNAIYHAACKLTEYSENGGYIEAAMRVHLLSCQAGKIAQMVITEEAPWQDIPSWNDVPHRTHAEVLAAFDRAIARALTDATVESPKEAVYV